MRKLKIDIGMAGLFTISFKDSNSCVHFLLSRDHWVWGHEIEPYDMCGEYYGFGPFFLVVISFI